MILFEKPVKLSTAPHAQLSEYAAYVILRCLAADVQLLCYFGIGVATVQEGEDFLFSRRQLNPLQGSMD